MIVRYQLTHQRNATSGVGSVTNKPDILKSHKESFIELCGKSVTNDFHISNHMMI